MKTFLLSTQGQQSQLLVFLFLTVIFSLFLLMVVCTGQRDRKKIYLNLATFLVLFALLVLLTDDFDQISRGRCRRNGFRFPCRCSGGSPVLQICCSCGRRTGCTG
ncbi:MAG: hypothetical protein MRZ97_04850 [Firmicutes bacterium]|nr:hypothetical protein [Bacillota bacterium]